MYFIKADATTSAREPETMLCDESFRYPYFRLDGKLRKYTRNNNKQYTYEYTYACAVKKLSMYQLRQDVYKYIRL